jgi:hypothetical protein
LSTYGILPYVKIVTNVPERKGRRLGQRFKHREPLINAVISKV